MTKRQARNNQTLAVQWFGYNVVPAKDGTAKIGEWNDYEITAKGRKIKVVLNGRTIVDTDLNDCTIHRR